MPYKTYFESGAGKLWNPEKIGTSCEGVIDRHSIVKGKKPYVVSVIVNKKTGEEISMSSSKRGLEMLQTVPKGIQVRITYTGESTKKYAGNKMKFYKIEVDGDFKPIKPLLVRKQK